jgi:Protein of unknown function (DUF3455)
MGMKNYISLLALALTIALPNSARAQGVTPPPVPTDIQVPEGNQAFLIGHGDGTQNYVCSPGKSVGQVVWTLFTPRATLFDDDGGQLTSHFFSPNPGEVNNPVRATWQDSQDSSTVWAKANASVVVDPTAVPWVLLEVVGKEVGPTGGATLFGTFIQRVNTVGGIAPTTGCDTTSDLGAKAFMPYTADYVFYKEN